MAQVRPIARDHLPGDHAVVASRQVHDGKAHRCRTPVTHSHAALSFCTAGRARIALRGAWELREGDLLLIPAGEPHRLLEARLPALWGLGFCVPCFAAGGLAPLLEPFERVRDGASAVVAIPSSRHEYLIGLLRELERLSHEPRAPGDTFEAVSRSLLTLVLAEVASASTASDRPRGAGGGVVADALRFIERHCLRPLALTEIAAAVGRTPAHVTTALSRTTGRSAGQWIVSGRMAEARRLLLHSGEMIDVIAGRVGYADSTHFIRLFRRAHGATPAAWRAARLGPRARPGADLDRAS